MQWKEQARAAESEVPRLQSRICHLEHASRAQETTLEQLKGRLADKVAKEERCARRDAEAYARLKRALLINKGQLNQKSKWYELQDAPQPKKRSKGMHVNPSTIQGPSKTLSWYPP